MIKAKTALRTRDLLLDCQDTRAMHWRRLSNVSSELVGQNKTLAVLRRSLVRRVVRKWQSGNVGLQSAPLRASHRTRIVKFSILCRCAITGEIIDAHVNIYCGLEAHRDAVGVVNMAARCGEYAVRPMAWPMLLRWDGCGWNRNNGMPTLQRTVVEA